MALRSDGTVWTWGSNTIGQLGTGLTVGTLDFTAHPTPVQVPRLAGIVAIFNRGACAMPSRLTVRCLVGGPRSAER